MHYSVTTRAELFVGNTWPSVLAVSVVRAAFRLPDALIAATAIEHKLGVATRNLSDFEQVRGLRRRICRSRTQS